MEKIRPLHSNVVIIPDSKEATTEGGLIIPDTAQVQVSTGTVHAVAAATLKFTPLVKAGDRVRYGKYAGVEVELPELVKPEATFTADIPTALIMPESEILCVI